jgi:hypothetical protein
VKKSDIFPTRFIKATDIGDSEINAVILGTKIEELGDERERKLIVYFNGLPADLAEKGLVVNATNFDRLAHCCKNEDTDMWPGNTVTLYTELVSFKGKTGPAVRVKAPAKPSTPVNADPRPEPPLNDAIPF